MTPHESSNIRMTPRLGRLRVFDHCSFFWADYRTHRVVQLNDDHCPRCLAELRRDALDRGAVLHFVRTDPKTSQVLEGLAHALDSEEEPRS